MTQSQLSQIDSAITAIETGSQEYSIGNRRYRRADLSVLYARRRELAQELIAAENTGLGISTFVVNFDGR